MDNQPSQTTNTAKLTPKIDTEELKTKFNEFIYQYKDGVLTGTYKLDDQIIPVSYGKGAELIVLYDPENSLKYKSEVVPLIRYKGIDINNNTNQSGYSFTKEEIVTKKTGGKRRQTKKSRRTRKTKRRLRKISKK